MDVTAWGLSAMDLVAVVGDQTWRTPGWPVALAVANAAVGILLGGGLWVHGRVGGLGQRGLGMVILGVTPVVAGLACALPFALLPAGLLQDAEFAIQAFWFPFAVELAASGVAMLAVALGIAAWVYAPRGGRGAPESGGAPALPVVPLLLAPVVLALAAAGPAHILALNAHGPLPALDVDIGPRVHVGIQTTVPVTLDEHAARGWFAPPVHVNPTVAGTFAIELRAERVGLTGVRVVTREAGDDRGTPLLPLAAGNSWDLQETVQHQAQYLWFLSGDHIDEGRHIHLSVDPGPQGPLRTWIVSRTDDDGAPTRWTVYNWNGEVLDAANDQPFIRVGVPTDDGLVGCGFVPLDGWECACGRPPMPPAGTPKGFAARWELQGPARCSYSETPGAVRTGVGAFLAMITVGLVIDMGDEAHTLVLVHSGKATM